jgi:hypothetical protein
MTELRGFVFKTLLPHEQIVSDQPLRMVEFKR